MNDILHFCISAAFIVLAGMKLSFYGDAIAAKTNLSRSFVGILLLATATSMPEVITCVTSAYVGKNGADLAIGNAFGSNMFNLFIIFFLDLFSRKGPILSRAGRNNILTAALSLTLLGVPMLGLVLRHLENPVQIPGIINFGLETLIILFLYVIAMRLLHKHDDGEDSPDDGTYDKYSKGHVFLMFALCAVGVVVAGYFCATSADKIAEIEIGGKAIGGTFIGVLLLAIATSLPEAVVAISAVRLGSVDMAMGNVLGSNIFNMAIIFLADCAFVSGPILATANTSHLIGCTTVLLMTSAVMIGLMTRAEKKSPVGISWSAIAILVFYLTGMSLIFVTR